ncbi:MAG: hypothetical protein PUK08_04480, partial [Campylobacter lanienae]|uniref:hypothetical protein n=1 Tax=Campylobacter lanienae TaxID=75658 RepID=UPI00243196D9
MSDNLLIYLSPFGYNYKNLKRGEKMCEFKLKELLTKESLLENGVNGLEEKFDEIAKILLTKTKIVKGTREYYITDIEFYLYCDGHEDIITYPRNCEAGDWFFHDSGVDISFESNIKFDNTGKAELSSKNIFGGILLRGIKPVGGYSSSKNLTDAPKNIVDELFDKFSAFEESEHFLVNFPLLKEESGHDLKD